MPATFQLVRNTRALTEAERDEVVAALAELIVGAMQRDQSSTNSPKPLDRCSRGAERPRSKAGAR